MSSQTLRVLQDFQSKLKLDQQQYSEQCSICLIAIRYLVQVTDTSTKIYWHYIKWCGFAEKPDIVNNYKI